MKYLRRSTVALVVSLLVSLSLSLGVAAQQPTPQPPSPELTAYTALREAKLGGEVATVTGLALKRDAGTLTLKSGELYFIAPVGDRVTGAVFVGDGEFTLTPPLECEKQAIAIYTKTPSITEHFSELVLRFSDETFAEVKASSQAAFSTGGPRADRAAQLLDDNIKLLRDRLRMNVALRILSDVYTSDKNGRGYFAAFVKGDRWSKLFYLVDPRGIPFVSPEQVALVSYGETDGGIWTAFPMSTDAIADSRTYDIKEHDIEATIDGTTLKAKDTMKIAGVRDGVRVLPFDLFPTLRVSKVTDASGEALSFVQQGKDDDAELAVVLAQPLARGAEVTITVEYAGQEAVIDAGGGNFILNPGSRSTWYPNNASSSFGDRAKFRTTYITPKKFTIVGTGAPEGEPTEEGDLQISRWTSGDLELAVTGFNYGRFKREELKDPETGYQLEFYANKEVPDQIREMQIQIEKAEAQGIKTNTTLGAISTTGMAKSALADTQNATRIYNAYFGKLPYTRVAMTQQPFGNFGQAWPTLVYMPFTAFLDTTIRMQMMGARGATDDFWKYVGPHEVAHQWWGHVIGWTSYRDQWMSEGFAEFSASLYVQHVRGMEPFVDFWESHRKEIVDSHPATNGKQPYTIGPVTQGFRLSGAKTGAVYRYLVYPKGAYILHMLRMLMFSPQTQDQAFIAMMKDFIQTYYNRDVSTEDFKKMVDKHMLDAMNLGGNGRMDWFFNQWVYGSEVPSYTFEYSLKDEGGKPTLSGKLTQSGVSDGFMMTVPIYLDFGKGWARLGQVALVGNASKEFKVPLPERPKRAAANALNDVLCVNMTNSQK